MYNILYTLALQEIKIALFMYHTVRGKDLGQTVHSDAASAATSDDVLFGARKVFLSFFFFTFERFVSFPVLDLFI